MPVPPAAVHGEGPPLHILLEREVALPGLGPVPVEMRDRLVPGVSLEAELEVGIPDLTPHAVPDLEAARVVPELLALHELPDRLDLLAVRAEEDFRHRIESPPVSTGFDAHLRTDLLVGGGDLRHHVAGPGEAGEGDFDARPRGLAGFQEDELVLVADDQGNLAGQDSETRKARRPLKPLRRRSKFRQGYLCVPIVTDSRVLPERMFANSSVELIRTCFFGEGL